LFDKQGNAKGIFRDFDGQLSDVREALKLDPNEAVALNSMGNALSGLGKSEEALTYLFKALAPDSSSYHLYVNIDFNDQSPGNENSAIEYLNKVILLNTTSPESYSNRSYSNRSYSLYKLEKTEEALKDINTALGIWKDNAYAYWIRALIYIRQNKIGSACDDLNTAEQNGFATFYGNAVEELKTKHCKK
jgi:tetratricopeptide (TPR) repeat protein